MTRAVGDDDSLLKSLQEVVGLFKEAQTSVFKLMSSVSHQPSLLIRHPDPPLTKTIGLGTQVPQRAQIRCRTSPAQPGPRSRTGESQQLITNGSTGAVKE